MLTAMSTRRVVAVVFAGIVSYASAFIIDSNNAMLLDFILDWCGRQCPGTVLHMGHEFVTANGAFVDELISTHPRPLTLIIQQLPPETKLVAGEEKLCSNAIVFRQCDSPDELFRTYESLKLSFFLRQMLIVTQCSSGWDVVPDILKRMEREDVSVVLVGDGAYTINRWAIDNRVHRSPMAFDKSNGKRTRTMGQRQLRLATLHFPPATFVYTAENGSVTYGGIEANLIEILAGQLNFTYTYVAADPIEGWGAFIVDGDNVTSTGLRGMTHRKEVDLVFGDIYMFSIWLPHIDFTNAFKTNYERFLVPIPRPYPKWMALILPFTIFAWISLLSFLVLVTLILCWMAKLSVRLPLPTEPFFKDPFYCSLYIVGSMLGVQQPRPIRNTPNRVFLIAWFFFATNVLTVYRSGLISFTTYPFNPPPINTVQQLAQSAVKKIMFKGGFKNELLNSTDPFLRQLGGQVVETDNLTYMYSLLETGEWAIESAQDSLLYQVATKFPDSNVPRFHLMKERMYPTLTTFALQKESALKPYFDRGLLRLTEAGLIDYHREKFAKSLKLVEKSPTNSATNQLTSFSLNNLQGAFYLILLGYAISTLVFFFEIISPPIRQTYLKTQWQLKKWKMSLAYGAATVDFA